MCGFVGGISRDQIDITNLNNANEDIICRGPDSKKISNGKFVNYNFSLIFNRLSILDLDRVADQPMHSEDGEYVLLFNGEIYNHVQLRKELERKIRFKTHHSDSEVILNGLIVEGLDFVNKLQGQFSIVFIDLKEKLIHLVRDRIGQKPLYYKFEKDSVFFSSSLTSLLKINKNYKLNENMLKEYLQNGIVGGSDTLFKNYFKVEPSESITISYNKNNLELSKKKYWQIENFVGEKAFDQSKFFSILSESINLRGKADVPIATFLSGGIDSSSIVKNMFEQKKEINTFSVKFSDSKYDESYWSNLVAKKYNTNHTEVFVHTNIEHSDILECLSSLDEPYYDPSVIPSYLISKEISKYYKVAISGDGGDELLGGYSRTMNSLKKFNKLETSFSYLYKLYPAAFGTGNIFLSKSSNLEKRYLSYLQDENFIKLLKLNPHDITNRIVLNKNFTPYKQLLIADYKFYLPDMMLYKIDRTSMSNSLEIRSPFVDHKLIEYVISSDTSYLDLNKSKAVLKKYLEDDFESNFIDRKKQGFAFNIENWVFSNLNILNEEINSGPVREFIPKNFSQKLSKIKSRINAHRIWKIYVLNNYLNNI